MIYTLTVNPSIDYIVSVQNFSTGKVNRSASEKVLAGGKGINVSTVLNNLGVENVVLGFVAGFTGKKIESLLNEKATSYKQNKMEDFFKSLESENEAISEKTSDTIMHSYLGGEDFEFGDLDVARFCESYRKIPSRVKTMCFRALESRYKYHPERLEKERNFLQNVLKTAQNIYDNAKRPLTPSIFAFYYLIRTIKEILGEKESVA